MRAHNAAKYVGRAIESILRQTDVQFELIVVDDASTDNIAAIVQAFADPRITLIRNERERGAGFCHNLALDRSRSEAFAVIDADGIALSSALRKLLDAFRSSSTIGMVHCYYFEIDGDDRATRHRFRAQRAIFQECLTAQSDYKKTLLRYGNISSHFRIYSTQAVETIGRFNESTRVDTDYDVALRIADRFEVRLVPEFLYCHRIAHDANMSWVRRFIYLRRLSKTNAIRFLSDKNYSVNGTMALALCDSLSIAYINRENLDPLLRRLKKAYIAVESSLYDFVVQQFASSSFRLLPSEKPAARNTRIAYYTWHFPVLSQTFINRELAALKRSGIPLEIIADEPEDVELADDNAKTLLAVSSYLDPVDKRVLRRYHRHFFRHRRLDYVKLFCFVVSRRYGPYKALREDIMVFSRAVHLAGILKDKRVDHLHSPWSDRCAFVAMLAARLAGTTYSVQARAHDIHRKSYLFALQEKFEPARFVVTNTRYNESYMKTFLEQRHWSKLFVIHNGVDLQRFVPHGQNPSRSGETRLLCVARMIEQKGLTYLLQACVNLRSQGYGFRCDLIGGTEDIYMNYYLELKKLHKSLGLEKEVRFRGSLPFAEVLKEYSETDIFVFPSMVASDGSRDITPNAVIEAMAMKLPVISTTVTGIPEIVEHGISGILVPPKDDAALTDAIVQLINNPDLRRQLGENARKRVENKFDINKNVQRYIELFSAGLATDRAHSVWSTTISHN
jgi:colanic acid/amylovoran biosynthesis glycosyltransferase